MQLPSIGLFDPIRRNSEPSPTSGGFQPYQLDREKISLNENCTIVTFEILPIRTAPERMHLICSSQCVDSIAESQCTSSTVGKQISVQRKTSILN